MIPVWLFPCLSSGVRPQPRATEGTRGRIAGETKEIGGAEGTTEPSANEPGAARGETRVSAGSDVRHEMCSGRPMAGGGVVERKAVIAG